MDDQQLLSKFKKVNIAANMKDSLSTFTIRKQTYLFRKKNYTLS